jgi:acyl-coenzyme A synthetase/AMP-(fatty) acid ligase
MNNIGAHSILDRPVESLVGWHKNLPVTCAELARDVAHLQGHLRDVQAPLINLCEDRYHFLVSLLAGLLCGRTNLLPHNGGQQAVAELLARNPGSRRLDDSLVAVCLQGPENAQAKTRAAAPFSADHTAAVVFTSGSTGVPTAHPKSWRTLVTGSRLLQRRLRENYGLRISSLAATVPPQHMYGLEATILLPALNQHPIHCGRPFFPADVLATLERLPPPRALITTPVHLRTLLDANLAWPALEFILSSTAPLPAELAARAEAAMGTVLIEIYGSSETGGVATRRTAREECWQPLAEVTIRQEESAAYIDAPHFPEPVRLGDALQMDEDNRFHLLGRDADMIKIAGKRASLADLTGKLLAIPGVIDGMVILPTETADRVTRPVALVVAPELSTQYVRRALAATVDPVFLPRPIYKVPTIPRNDTGKPARRAVLDMIERLEHLP